VDDGSTLVSNITVYVTPSGAAALPDLTVSAKDIRATTNADGSVMLTADIRNQGTAAASNFQVAFYEFDSPLGTTQVTQLPPQEAEPALVTLPAGGSGERLIRVVVNQDGAVAELSEDNNEASQLIRIGTAPGPVEGNILVTGSLPTRVYMDSLFSVGGHAAYAINVNGTTNTDYAVKGGGVNVTITADDGTRWVYGGIHTDVNGNFRKFMLAPTDSGTYRLLMTVTDQTLVGTRELVVTVVERPAAPEAPPSPPIPAGDGISYGTGYWHLDPGNGTWNWIWTTPPQDPIPGSDLRVFSEDIHFSQDHPAANDEITLFAAIHYWATSTSLIAQNVPVSIYVTDVAALDSPRV
jgi:hypothetical protein